MRRISYLVFLLRINSAIINSIVICSLQLQWVLGQVLLRQGTV